MAAGTLYTYPDSFRANKILIAAEYSGATVNVPPFKLGQDNQTPDFLNKFPLGKVPAFQTKDGKCIYESNAIAYYVANDQLKGTNPVDAALVQQYVHFADQEVLPAAATWVFPTLGLMQYNKQATDKAMEDIKKYLGILNDALLTRTFLVGERVTLADISVACNLIMLYKQVLEPCFRAPFGNVNRWFITLINQPQFKKIVGSISLCTSMAKFDGKKYAELHPKKEDKKKSAKEEKKKQEPKKAEKKKEEPKDDEEDEAPAPAQKVKDPYANFPKSSFVMDAFKKVYSNEDTLTKAIPWLWENFDKENHSIWHAVYKYQDELKKVFMACNLVGGMFQRIDRLRKHAFASVCISGEDKNCAISGIWIFKGHEVAFNLVEDWNVDAPSYDFKKLDPEKDRELINKYLMQEGEFDGLAVNQGKVFK